MFEFLKRKKSEPVVTMQQTLDWLQDGTETGISEDHLDNIRVAVTFLAYQMDVIQKIMDLTTTESVNIIEMTEQEPGDHPLERLNFLSGRAAELNRIGGALAKLLQDTEADISQYTGGDDEMFWEDGYTLEQFEADQEAFRRRQERREAEEEMADRELEERLLNISDDDE